MANEYSSVTCYERFGTAREEYDDERGLMSATVQLFCAYTDRHRLASDILSNHRAWPKGSASLIPTAYGAGIEPWDDVGSATGQMINPGTALVTIRYSTKRVEIITEEIEPIAEFVPMPYQFFRWFPSGDLITEDEAPGWIKRSCNFVRNEMFVSPDAINSDLYNLVGSVNDSEFISGLLPGFVAPAESLLFNPPVIHMKYNSVGDTQYDLTKRFNFQPQGWNSYFRTKTQQWEQISFAGSGTAFKNYPPASFANILNPQSPYLP